jgi:MarR family transcriptional regulator for hemolysin
MLPSLEERFSSALHHTARAWRQALDRRLKDLGVGQAGWMAIAVIAKASQAPSQTELAHKLAVEDPTMVAMIDRLVKAGLVSRVPSQTDRRVKLVVLTTAGNHLYKKVRTEADAFRAEILAPIDANQLRIATELLETLQAAAEAAP